MRTGCLLLLLAACDGNKAVDGDANDGAGDADTDADADSDTDADADADSDADTDTDTDTDVPPECTVAIPPTAIVVADQDVVDAAPDAAYWVCKSRNLSYSGSGASIFVELDGDVVLNGTSNTVWLKGGGGLALFQAGNDIRYEDAGDVNDESGGPTTLTDCPSLVFDYTNAPQPGCNIE